MLHCFQFYTLRIEEMLRQRQVSA